MTSVRPVCVQLTQNYIVQLLPPFLLLKVVLSSALAIGLPWMHNVDLRLPLPLTSDNCVVMVRCQDDPCSFQRLFKIVESPISRTEEAET